MIGASAGVMAVFIFMSTYSPDLEIRLILFNVKLRYLGIAFLLLDIVQIPYGNAGGHLAHLGGAILGFYYVKKLKNGKDIGKPFKNFIDKTINIFRRKPKMRTVYKREKSKYKLNFIHIQNGESTAGKYTQQLAQAGGGSGFEPIAKDALLYTERSITNLLFGGEHSYYESGWKVNVTEV